MEFLAKELIYIVISILLFVIAFYKIEIVKFKFKYYELDRE